MLSIDLTNSCLNDLRIYNTHRELFADMFNIYYNKYNTELGF